MGCKKLTIEAMHALAESRGGKCLSEDYIDSKTKLEWECKCGHQWEATPSNIKNKTWCPECNGSKKHTIEQMHALAKEKGGKCLSDKYTNCDTKIEWECECGYKWKATPNDIKNNNRWCPKCSKQKSKKLN